MTIKRKNQTRKRKQVAKTIDPGERWFLEGGNGNRDECLAYYEAHKSKIINEYVQRCPGNRPWAWWAARGMTEPEHPADRLRLLHSMGELSPAEVQALQVDPWGARFLKEANILIEGEL